MKRSQDDAKQYDQTQKEDEEMSTILVDKHLTLREALKEACKQMKLMREGTIPKETWSDFVKELEEDED